MKKKTFVDQLNELTAQLDETKHQLIANIPGRPVRNFLSTAFGANKDRIQFITSSYARNQIANHERFMTECERKGLDHLKVIEIAKASPFSTNSVLFEIDNEEELDAYYDLYVKGDRRKWEEMAVTRILKQ